MKSVRCAARHYCRVYFEHVVEPGLSSRQEDFAQQHCPPRIARHGPRAAAPRASRKARAWRKLEDSDNALVLTQLTKSKDKARAGLRFTDYHTAIARNQPHSRESCITVRFRRRSSRVACFWRKRGIGYTWASFRAL
eukprot:3715492-Rhodomonas_salina.1